jgi:GntR family transcriptional repressor for pyruvate dehydrogenase complex
MPEQVDRATAPVPAAKASQTLADDLRERILGGEFVEGTPLPPERELVTQHGMGRTTVREALRVLEVQGLVEIKTGRNGGAYVRKPSQDSVASTVSLFIRGGRIKLTDLLESREAIEPQCARLAAKYRTDEDLARLDAANEAIAVEPAGLAAFLQANVDWHISVAMATHNELLTGFMLALSRAIYASTENEAFVDDVVRRTAMRAHRSITRAIRDRDADAAERRMVRHVHEYAEAVLDVEERTDVDVD